MNGVRSMDKGSQEAVRIYRRKPSIESAFVIYLSLYSTAMPLLPQNMVFKSSSSTASLIELYSSEGCQFLSPGRSVKTI